MTEKSKSSRQILKDWKIKRAEAREHAKRIHAHIIYVRKILATRRKNFSKAVRDMEEIDRIIVRVKENIRTGAK